MAHDALPPPEKKGGAISSVRLVLPVLVCRRIVVLTIFCSYTTTRETANGINAPSGIAQLRKTSDQTHLHADPMNLDDFIFPENVATPAGLAATPSPDATKQEGDRIAHTTAAAIPIKSRKTSSQHFVPQSVPVPAHQRNQDEFAYVTRHHRKTSIDERRVSKAKPPLFAKESQLIINPLHFIHFVTEFAILPWSFTYVLLYVQKTNHDILLGSELEAACKLLAACFCSQ